MFLQVAQLMEVQQVGAHQEEATTMMMTFSISNPISVLTMATSSLSLIMTRTEDKVATLTCLKFLTV